MVEIFNWFLAFVASVFDFIFNDLVSADGYSMGYMVLGITLMAVIVGGTIGVVGIFSHSMNQYATQSARASNRRVRHGSPD